MADLNATLIRKTEISHGLYVLRIAPDGWQYPDFRAGQFANIGLPGTHPRCAGSKPDKEVIAKPDEIIRRSYSIASSPREAAAFNYVELYINMVDDGLFTPRLFDLNVGDKLWLMQRPAGMFTLQGVPEDKHLVFISTGTGLGPYISILRTILAEPSQKDRKFAVLHGVRHSLDLGFQSELETMARLSGGRLVYLPTLSRPQNEHAPWKGLTGYVQDLWNSDEIAKVWGFAPGLDNCHIYLCGNPKMIEDMQALLYGAGYRKNTKGDPGGQVHTESYW